jgi:hypothetical protein
MPGDSELCLAVLEGLQVHDGLLSCWYYCQSVVLPPLLVKRCIGALERGRKKYGIGTGYVLVPPMVHLLLTLQSEIGHRNI